MEELYRYLMIRSAESIEPEPNDDVIDLSSENNLYVSLSDTKNQEERSSLARNFINSRRFVHNENQIPYGSGFSKIADHFRSTSIADEVSASKTLDTIIDILEASDPDFVVPRDTQDDQRIWLRRFVSEVSWVDAENRLHQSILAIRESNLQIRKLEKLVDITRAMQLLKILASKENDTIRPGAILKASFYLPDIRESASANEPTENDVVEPDSELVTKREDFINVSKALDELLNVPLTRLEVKESQEQVASETNSESDGTIRTRVSRKVTLGRTYDRLSQNTKAVLGNLSLDGRVESLDEIVDIIRSHQQKNTTALYTRSRRFVSGTALSKAKITATDFLKGLLITELPALTLIDAPKTTGDVSPVGVGDLMLVKQHLKRYEGGDIAHVENILKGESKEREHRRRRLSETTFISESETEISEERETQTTSRFEMRLEAQKQMQQEFGTEAGVKINASYGPTVEMEANTQFAYKNAKSESQSRAVSMSKELVEKAATKYREKLREQVTRRLVEEVEEFNRHALDATDADQHVVGMYQWLNKIYEAQVYNYGKRVMYEFMVPEPAAHYIWSLSQKADLTEGLKVPPPFSVSAENIYEWNYQALASFYKATDVEPPPEPYITVVMKKSGGPNPQDSQFIDLDTATIPEGYEYVDHVAEHLLTWKTHKPQLAIAVSDVYKNPGQVAVIFSGNGITGWTAYVQLKCRRTKTAFERWRNKVWDALHQGHLQQVATYEEKLAALTAQAGVQIQGRNPHSNRRIEQTELKKSCLTLITGTHPNWAGGTVDTKSGPVIKPSVVNSHGPYVRFMEQAFEWENMTYVFYPYFWARASQWQSLLEIEDIDPGFQEFLTSGYARVVAPVRPGFEKAVEHFRQTGQVWSGGQLPAITDPDYLPIWEEIKARLDAPGEEEPVGEPWEVLVPTQLVKLRNTDDLPQWEKLQDGTWKEVQ
ncbi:MAG: hypothetical protein AAFY20_23015 [Cyanobacteria bacterium J06639_14]